MRCSSAGFHLVYCALDQPRSHSGSRKKRTWLLRKKRHVAPRSTCSFARSIRENLKPHHTYFYAYLRRRCAKRLLEPLTAREHFGPTSGRNILRSREGLKTRSALPSTDTSSPAPAPRQASQGRPPGGYPHPHQRPDHHAMMSISPRNPYRFTPKTSILRPFRHLILLPLYSQL